MPDTGAPYFIPYAEPSDLVRDWPDLSEDVALAIVAALENIPVTEKRIEAFTASGTWTVPAGVTYAIAHMLGGGGGVGQNVTAGNGNDSSVAFASGTVSGLGGVRGIMTRNAATQAQAAIANSGTCATMTADSANTGGFEPQNYAPPAQWTVAAAAVTPAASITVTVGAGGSAGTNGALGGSGQVWIEYYEEA